MTFNRDRISVRSKLADNLRFHSSGYPLYVLHLGVAFNNQRIDVRERIG